MKNIKLILSVFFILTSINLLAQKKLTNREIYNFNVGDIIHTKYTYESSPTFVNRKFLDKKLSVNQDTIIFEVVDTIYELSQIPNWKMRVENNIIKYSLLDSFPTPFDQNSEKTSYQRQYSTNIDTCGNLRNSYVFTNAPDTIIILDRESYEEIAFEGLGKYITHQYQDNRRLYYELLYYKKSGIECGKQISILGINNNLKTINLSIYPNPSSNEINIVGINDGYYELYDMYGKSVLKGNIEGAINITPIKIGLYTLLVKTDDKIYSSKFVKQ